MAFGKVLHFEPLFRDSERIASGAQPRQKRFVHSARIARPGARGLFLRRDLRGMALRRQQQANAQPEFHPIALQSFPLPRTTGGLALSVELPPLSAARRSASGYSPAFSPDIRANSAAATSTLKTGLRPEVRAALHARLPPKAIPRARCTCARSPDPP